MCQLPSYLYLLLYGALCLIPDSIYAQSLAPAKDSKGKYGYQAGQKWVIKAQYEDARPFSEGLAAVKVKGVWGFVDSLGKMVITPQYLDVRSLRSGLIAVRTNDFGGDAMGKYITKQGSDTKITNCYWEYMQDFYGDIAFARRFPFENKCQMINKQGEELEDDILSVGTWRNGLCMVEQYVKFDKKTFFYVNTQGQQMGDASCTAFDIHTPPAWITRESSDFFFNKLYEFALVDQHIKRVSNWYSLIEPMNKEWTWVGGQGKDYKLYYGLLHTTDGDTSRVMKEATGVKGMIHNELAYLGYYKRYLYFHLRQPKQLTCSRPLVSSAWGHIAYTMDGKCGVVDDALDWLVKPEYDSIRLDFAAQGYALCYQGGKCGVMDRKWAVVIAPQYHELSMTAAREWIFKQNTNTWGVLTAQGQVLRSFTADSIRLEAAATTGLVFASKKSNWGAFDTEGKAVIAQAYPMIEWVIGNLIATFSPRGFWLYGAHSGKVLYQGDYPKAGYGKDITGKKAWLLTGAPSELALVSFRKKLLTTSHPVIEDLVYIGRFDSEGQRYNYWANALTETVFQVPEAAMPLPAAQCDFCHQVAPHILSVGAASDQQLSYQYYDLRAAKQIGGDLEGLATWKTETHWTQTRAAREKVTFSDVVAIVPGVVKGAKNLWKALGGGATYSSYTTTHAEWRFWGGVFSDNMALVSQDNKLGYMRMDGTMAIAPQYKDAGDFAEGRAAVLADTVQHLWGFIDEAGKLVIAAKYQQVGGFSRGVCPVWQNDKVHYIDYQGNTVFGGKAWADGQPFRGGLAAVQQDGKWGYIDLQGNWKISPQFDSALPFEAEQALVRRAGEGYWIHINTAGEPIY